MNILVTGANGFIGTVLVHQLLSAGHYVKAPIREKRSLQHWQHMESYLFCHAQPEKFKQHFQPILVNSLHELLEHPDHFKDIDAVIHLAGYAHQLNLSETDAAIILDFNHHFTYAFAKFSEQQGIKHFVFISTIKVNGENNNTPFTENDHPQPDLQDAYAMSKYNAEKALLTIMQAGKLPITIIRMPLVYGPGVKANFAKLLAISQKKFPFPVFKSENKRSFCYVENLTAFINHCVLKKAAFNQLFLIADQEQPLCIQTLMQYLGRFNEKKYCTLRLPHWLIYTIAKLFRKTSHFKRIYHSLTVDCTKANTTLNWNQPVPQIAGLYATVRWYNMIQKD